VQCDIRIILKREFRWLKLFWRLIDAAYPSRYSETGPKNPEPIRLPNFRDIARATTDNLLSSCKNRLKFFHFQIIPRIVALRTTQHQTIFRTRTCLILESCAAIGLWCRSDTLVVCYLVLSQGLINVHWSIGLSFRVLLICPRKRESYFVAESLKTLT